MEQARCKLCSLCTVGFPLKYLRGLEIQFDGFCLVVNWLDFLLLSSTDKPVCRPEQKNSYGGAKGLTSEVECHVESKPGATSFRWTFNGTGELVDLTSGYRTTADGSISILRYTPRSEMDFGTLLCWAANPLGLQSQPCVFHFYAAGKLDFKFNSILQLLLLLLLVTVLVQSTNK